MKNNTQGFVIVLVVYANWKWKEIAAKTVIPVQLQGGNIIFVDVGLTLFHWEMFQIAWKFMCLLSWYGSYYILKW